VATDLWISAEGARLALAEQVESKS
jgi:hypothetical protein